MPHVGNRIPLPQAKTLAAKVIALLQKNPNVKRVTIAGSLRRQCETVGDIDILASGDNAAAIMQYFITLSGVKEILSVGDVKASVVIEEQQVDLRVTREECFGAALQYFTGSKEHNIKLRSIAKAKGLKLNEYGVFKGNECLGRKTEEEVYQAIGVPIMPPERR